MKLRPSRRDLITGAAALAAYSQIGDAEAVNKLLLMGGAPHFPGAAVDMNFATGQYYGGSLSSLISVSRASGGYATNADGSLTYFGNNVPRIGNGTGLLIEQASTNLNNYSQQLANSYWLQTSIVTVQNNLIAPDGSLTGNTITTNTSTNQACRNSGFITIPTSTVLSISCIAKQGSANLGLNYSNGSGGNVQYGKFTLSGAGSVSGVSGSAVASISPLANGWYLCNIVLTTTVANGYVSAGPWDGSADNFNYPATSSICNVNVWAIWSEQLSFHTSYIPTTSGTVTRAADNISAVGALLAAYQSAAFTQYAKNNNVTISNAPRLGGSFNGSSTVGFIQNATTAGIFDGTNVTTTPLGSGNYSSGSVSTVGSYGPAGGTIVANGGSEATHSQALAAVTVAHIGSDNATNQFLNGYLKRLAVFNSQLPSSQRLALSLQ